MKFVGFALIALALQSQPALSSISSRVDKKFEAQEQTLNKPSRSGSGASVWGERKRNDDPLVDHRMPPNPKPYRVTYDDGTISPLIYLRIRGDETDPAHQAYEETLDGFTVGPSNGKYVYLDVNDDTGDYIKTDLVVGLDDPFAARIRKDAWKRVKSATDILPGDIEGSIEVDVEFTVPSDEDLLEVDVEFTVPSDEDLLNRKLGGERGEKEEDDNSQEQPRRRTQITSGTLKNLVIPFKFSDHVTRTVPTRADLDILMNHQGSHTLAPTGSVRDVYIQNSFGALDVDSTVIDWVTIDYTEAYCADGRSGGTLFHTCLANALDKAVAAGVNFADYDVDGNGYIDGIAFFQSGYGAEWGGNDAYGTNYLNRIWSHKWSLYTQVWQNNGVRVYDYHISPAVWGRSGSTIGRIGVVAHETGHFLGLPDLYDYGAGSGIGSWGMMANSWGFDSSQYYPPLMSAWSKMKLDWVTPTVVSTSGTYTLSQSCDHQDVIRIDLGFQSGQYLLIENRQRCGYDEKVPQGGLAIFYIDDNANNNRGYPGQSGWPGNGNHYEVALLQADGNYNMERGSNRGDSGDLFHGNGVNSIGPDGTSSGASYPNTRPYDINDNGHTYVDLTISNISPSGGTMSLDIVFDTVPMTPSPTKAPLPVTDSPTKAPFATTSAPTKAPVVIPSLRPSLSTCGDGICQIEQGEGCAYCSADCTFSTHCNIATNSGSGVYSTSAYGLVFDTTVGPTDLYFYGLKVYLRKDATAKIYMKDGSFSDDNNLDNWTVVFDGTVSDVGSRQEIQFQSRFYAAASSTVAFYISYTEGGAFVYSRDTFSNNDVTVTSGNTMRQQSGNTLPSTAFSGRYLLDGIRYDLSTGPAPTLAPVPVPITSAPSTSPNENPSGAPSTSPVATTAAPVPSTTLAPVVSPTSTCSCCEEMRSRMEHMASMLETIITILDSSTPAPVASPTPPPVACTDRTGTWKIGNVNRAWCTWAGTKNTVNRCTNKNLFVDCPKTCDRCP